MNLRKPNELLLTAAALLATGTSYSAVLDQSNLPNVLQINGATPPPAISWQQEVVVGITGQLTAMSLWSGEGSTVFRLSINKGSGWQTDADDFAVLVSTAPYTEYTVDLSSAGLTFATGDHFMIGIQGHPPNGGGNLYGSVGNSYANGTLWESGSPYLPDWDLAFQTYVTSVPEPSRIVLSAVGILAMALRRKFSRRVEANSPAESTAQR